MPSYTENIKQSRLSIYDPIDVNDTRLWIPTPQLEEILNQKLIGVSLEGLALRTRSKVVKEEICRALGYPVPKSFKKTQPRFIGQQFDVYTQKSQNLQIWNEDISPVRRYVLIQVSPALQIQKVKIVTGKRLAELDTTGTLTQKFQARLNPGDDSSELISPQDTPNILPLLSLQNTVDLGTVGPTQSPQQGFLLPIQKIYKLLIPLLGNTFPDAGIDQERNRGAKLHKMVCTALGYQSYRDAGTFPDIPNQLLETKLQTSPTIDLGLVNPNSNGVLPISKIDDISVVHSDVRYVLFYGNTDGQTVELTHLYVTSGMDFFDRFPQFRGKVINKKIQILLPRDFFDR